jgi:hypothetical protein
MTKSELLKTMKQRGANGTLTAMRVARSCEIGHLSDDVDITLAMLQSWIEESPR